ncbi:hypothetical protein BKA61DRAFT_673959 [Leptodontidium sp. MPI-SDFR-AT-0119]|nr:hypothetical protein BKA61DRAFT_673959 [Leptodontidium sp. MPI-SDFR-AT-0119]
MATNNDRQDISVLITDKSVKIIMGISILLGTIFVVCRFYIRYTRQRLWGCDDSICIIAWGCFVGASIGYASILAPMSRIAAVGRGDAPVYATMQDDAAYFSRVFFATVLLFWSILWLVKVYLLIQVKKFVDRLRTYMIIWWVIVGYTALVFVGCIIGLFLECHSFSDGLRGNCATERDVYAIHVIQWWAFSADMSTDAAIALFPIPILMKMKLSRRRKWGTIAVFSVGFLSAIASIVRIMIIMSASGKKEPNIPWQATWGII